MKAKQRINRLDMLIFIFAFLFLYAAFSKLIEFDQFKAQIGKSPLIMRYSTHVSWLVPVLEIIIAILLLIQRLQLFALYAFYFVMLTFSFYIAFILTFSPYVPCACGGVLSGMDWVEHLVFNMVFVSLAIYGILLFNHQNAIDARIETEQYRN